MDEVTKLNSAQYEPAGLSMLSGIQNNNVMFIDCHEMMIHLVAWYKT